MTDKGFENAVNRQVGVMFDMSSFPPLKKCT